LIRLEYELEPAPASGSDKDQKAETDMKPHNVEEGSGQPLYRTLKEAQEVEEVEHALNLVNDEAKMASLPPAKNRPRAVPTSKKYKRGQNA
jgi:hypothetical protein